MRKPRSWLTLGGCFLVQFWCFLCFFLLSFRPCAQNGILLIFMRFWGYFRLHFLSFLEQGRSSLFATLPSETMIFKVPGLLFLSVFFQSFPHSIPDLIFLVFLMILGSPGLPFSSFWVWFFHIKKKSKNGMRVFTEITSVCEYWMGGIPLNRITVSPEDRFSTSVHSSGAWRHGGGSKKIETFLYSKRRAPIIPTFRLIKSH